MNQQTDFETMPVECLKQLDADAAAQAIGDLNQIDIAIQKGTDRSFSDSERARRHNIHARINMLTQVIRPQPVVTAEQTQLKKQARARRLEQHTQARRQLPQLKTQWTQDGTWKQLSHMMPAVTSGSMVSRTDPDHGVPAELQRYIGMSYLLTGVMPDQTQLMSIMQQALDTREIRLIEHK